NPRLASFALTSPAERVTVIVGSGTDRAADIRAPLAAKLADGFITIVPTASRVLGGFEFACFHLLPLTGNRPLTRRHYIHAMVPRAQKSRDHKSPVRTRLN